MGKNSEKAKAKDIQRENQIKVELDDNQGEQQKEQTQIKVKEEEMPNEKSVAKSTAKESTKIKEENEETKVQDDDQDYSKIQIKSKSQSKIASTQDKVKLEESDLSNKQPLTQSHQSDKSNSQLKQKIKQETESVHQKDQLKRSHQQQEKQQDNDSDNENEHWQYLEHHGVVFPEFYKRHNIKILYDKQPLELTLQQEELATYFAQSLNTDWAKKKIYIDNFTKEFMKAFPNRQHLSFEKFDFLPIKDYLDQQREIKKNRPQEIKLKEREERMKRDAYYGWAILNNNREKMGNFCIEPPNLFKGRGEQPNSGKLKTRINPEQLTINIAKNAPVPKCHVKGHCWGDIVHKNDVTWLAGYKIESYKKNNKYIFLAAQSSLKSKSDLKKYEKARRLKDCIQKVRSNYQNKLKSNSIKDKQLGTATYLIDKLALRVGNEKNDDEADTVGCCSLRVEHVQVKENNQIYFNFLGKDSMRYENTVPVDELVWQNIRFFLKNKKDTDDLFDKIDASILNDYLKTLMEGLTAKVFRTYNASFTLQRELDKWQDKISINSSIEEKKKFYNDANRQVAILCNHQKTANKNVNETIKLMDNVITEYEKYLDELKSHKDMLQKSKRSRDDKEEIVVLYKKSNGQEKNLVKKFPGQLDKCKLKIKKTEEFIQNEKMRLEEKDQNKEVALGTSKTNYNDPRISTSWCKCVELPIDKVFNNSLMQKFVWAMETEPEWKF